ncbi:trypsin-like serine peptidase [Kitasatospora sp. NPDC127121]|uniref:trypsin-like serine peptidase n=1 Tax=Kitasatospora sp. NPDC127121 TaxID=3345371 RepID=UPI00362B409A
MSPMYRPSRAVLGASVAALTVLAATACGPDNSDPVVARTTAPTVAAGATGKPGAAPIKLPTAEELKTWKFEDWDKWAQQNVIAPAVKGYWTLQRILNAKPKPMPQPQPDPTQPPAQPTGAAPAQPTSKPATPAPAQPTTAQPPSTGDALPTVIEAKPTQHPFAKNLHVNGKLFFKDGNEDYVCSGTVVSDPANPGKSNLVWTASHCLNGGKGGQYYTNISFAPAYNSNGLLSGGKQANETDAEPYGEWGATAGMVSPQWSAEADPEHGGPWSQYDFGIIKVANPGGNGKSLEETVGGSVPIWFNAPREQFNSVSAYGYPAGKPFDGVELDHCDSGKPAKKTGDPSRPAMLMIGCNMTGGSSGGGWVATKDGKPALVSDTSIGNGASTWEAGPYLDDVAARMFDYFSKKSK